MASASVSSSAAAAAAQPSPLLSGSQGKYRVLFVFPDKGYLPLTLSESERYLPTHVTQLRCLNDKMKELVSTTQEVFMKWHSREERMKLCGLFARQRIDLAEAAYPCIPLSLKLQF